MTAPEEQAVPDLTPEALDTIEAEKLIRELRTVTDITRQRGGSITITLGEGLQLLRALESQQSELRRLRTENEEYRRIVFDPISDYYGEIRIKFDAVRAALTGEATE